MERLAEWWGRRSCFGVVGYSVFLSFVFIVDFLFGFVGGNGFVKVGVV